MKAAVLRRTANIEEYPLSLEELPAPSPAEGEILIRISVCGICRTELDEVEGRLKTKLPVIPGHQVVGRVEEGAGYERGERVGVAWIYWACGKCRFCLQGMENLCPQFRGTGCDVDGGYAEYMVVPREFAYPLPPIFSDAEAAPLLCGGAIGYRALRLTGMKDGEVIGLYGYGSSAHVVHQLIRHFFPSSEVYVFTKRRGDRASELAKKQGADWVGETGDTPPKKLHRALDTAPSGETVREALRNLERGGRLVMNLIRKESPIPELDYVMHLWQEKEVKSVANITRQDVREFLKVAAEIPIRPEVTEFRLEEANRALIALKRGEYRGSGVLRIS
ncbi:MAG: zinc-dependent alcohol dehydrogenase family protein [Candidatus Hadarchaeales archaeon]